MKPLPLTALVAMLALSACDFVPERPQPTPTPTPATTAAQPVTDDVKDGTLSVSVASVPKAAADVSEEEAQPLADAGEIEQEIQSGQGIERVRHGEGWAWRRGGRIVRTADRDGGNPAYFRNGEDRPFFIQRGERGFAYQGGRPLREFDRDGRAHGPDADRQAFEAAQEARDQRDPPEQDAEPESDERDANTDDRPRGTRRPRGERPQDGSY